MYMYKLTACLVGEKKMDVSNAVGRERFGEIGEDKRKENYTRASNQYKQTRKKHHTNKPAQNQQQLHLIQAIHSPQKGIPNNIPFSNLKKPALTGFSAFSA